MSSVILPLLYGLLAIGQTSPPVATPTPPAGTVPPKLAEGPTHPIKPSSDRAGDVFFDPDENGRLRAIPVDDAIQAGAEFLRHLQGDGRPATAAVYVSRLLLDGEIVGDRAEFKVSITIEVTRAEGWYDVPLALHEAHVHESKYEGPGNQAPRTGGPAEDGLHWSLNGQGTHRLELKFDVPLKQSPAGQQLQLRLPQLPDLFRPRCVLRIPGGPVVVTAKSGTPVPVHVLESGDQEVDLNVMGQRLDLSWRPHTDESLSLSTFITSFDLHRSGGQLELVAAQQCDVEQGTVTRIEVRMPSDTQFGLGSIGRKKGINQPPALLRHFEMEERPGWVQVELDEPMSGRFELEWKFARPFPQSGDVILIDGLELAAARIQQGRVELQPFDGYDVNCLEEVGSGLQETNPVSQTALKAFEFRRQPFRLDVEVSRIQPKLIATPRYYLRLDTDQADLYLEAQVSVLAGVVDELLIEWPTRGNDGWSCNSAVVDVQVESGLDRTTLKATVVAGGTALPPGTIRLQFSQPVVGRSTETVRLRLIVPFVRVIQPDESGFDLTVPRLGGAATQPGAVFIAGGMKLEPFLAETSDPPDKLPPPATAVVGIPAGFAEPTVLGFSLAASPAPLPIGWVEHSRTISTESNVSVVELRRGAVNVVQRVSYAVSYGEVSSLLLELPPAIDELLPPGIERLGPGEESIVLFRLDDGTVLAAERAGANLRIPLPAPRHGQFDLFIDYVWPVPAASVQQSAPFELPIVRTLDAEFGRIVISTRDSERIRLDDSEQGWTSLAPRSGGVAWQTLQQRSEVRLTLDESLLNVPQQYTIHSAFLLTRFGQQGEAITLAEYVVQDAPSRLLIMLPHADSPVEFRWDGAVLELDRQAVRIEGLLDKYTLDLPTAEGEQSSGRLSVKYQSPSHGPLGLIARRSIEFPRFPGKVWVNETWFEVVLPTGSQLFEPPPNMAPQYTWQRRVAVWMRQSTPEYQQRRIDLFPASEYPQFQSARGNSYAYHALGPVARATCGALSQSLIVLIGAGLTLFLGFLFGRVPATRNVFSLIFLGFLFALAGVWHLELMELLLQPALLGLLLAAIATMFDTATRRRLALAPSESAVAGPPRVDHELRSTGASSASSPPARTAVYRSVGTSDSGGTL